MNLPEFELIRPESLAHAADLVADGATPYCGGTELLAAMGMGLLRPESLVSLRKLDELSGVSLTDGMLRIGATVTHRDVSRLGDVRTAAPMLAEVAERVGNVRVRATGTIGGNLAFGEPRSDVSSALIALGATVLTVSSADGGRRVPAEEFVRGAFDTDLRPGELVVAIELDSASTDVAVYYKIVFSERPVVGVALARVAQSGVWRVVVGAVGEQPFRAEFGELDDDVAAGIADGIEVSADLAGSADYKRHLTEVAISRAFALGRTRVGELAA
jgi:carbon-monoxide dehydrogenase medium subunit